MLTGVGVAVGVAVAVAVEVGVAVAVPIGVGDGVVGIIQVLITGCEHVGAPSPEGVKHPWITSVPTPPEPVYVKLTWPLASVVQSEGLHVPVAPALGPESMVKVTRMPDRGLPIRSVTVAVTVWFSPTTLVAAGGASVMPLKLQGRFEGLKHCRSSRT